MKFNMGTVSRLWCKNCREDTLHTLICCSRCRCLFFPPIANAELDIFEPNKKRAKRRLLRGMSRL